MDNFYNSFDLASKLIEKKKTFFTSTLDQIEKYTTDVVELKLNKGETVVKYYQGVMIEK